MTSFQEYTAKLKLAGEKATKGPWKYDVGNHQIETLEDRIEIVNEVSNYDRAEDIKARFESAEDLSEILENLGDSYEDMHFIELARNEWTNLIGLVERYRQTLIDIEELSPLHERERRTLAREALSYKPWRGEEG